MSQDSSLLLHSAYRQVLGVDMPTSFTDKYAGVLDYVFASDGLTPTAVLDKFDDSVLREEVALPSSRCPSDHLPLVTVLDCAPPS